MKDYIKVLSHSPKFILGVCLLVFVFGFAYLYPVIQQGDPFAMVGTAFEAPSKSYPLGTDNFGRDMLLELAYGVRTSVTVGFLAGILATFIGLGIGLVSGYKGGLIDEFLMSVTNMFIVIPSFIILILVSVSIDTRSIYVTAGIIGVTSWPWTARAVRAQAASLRNRDHVAVAKLSGFSTPKIIIFEIFPYIASYVVMAFIIQLASGILAEAGVSMLGLGPYNTISLGLMMNWAIMFEAPRVGAWWAFIPQAAVIATITFSLYLINMGMDELFNPKLRG